VECDVKVYENFDTFNYVSRVCCVILDFAESGLFGFIIIIFALNRYNIFVL
jgi:hypothetical protein